MQKVFKVLLIIAMAVATLVAITLVVIFVKLPSVASIGQALGKKKPVTSTAAPRRPEVTARADSADPSAAVPAGDLPHAAPPATTEEQKAAKQAMLTDILSNDKPLSDFCRSLKNANANSFTSNDQIDAALLESSLNEDKDPRIQALKPTFRYIMRLPKMNELLRQAEIASETGDESLFEKADFYAKAFAAFSEIKDHKGDLEALMDRSYFYVKLNKLVAERPELFNDARVQNYCGNVELAFNQSQNVSLDRERTEFLGLLRDLNVSPDSVGYDPNYKTQIEFEMSARNISLNGNSWLNEIFKAEAPPSVEGAPPDRTETQGR
ncbi:MAG: hypothetical protein H7061_07815 [Bdellovibrionaceae bacterium]|nr:hypothetical protein [Bdellovibrio sp.]